MTANFGDVAEGLRRSTVQVRDSRRRGSGSGVIWSSGGLIVTNAHVARDSRATVELWDGRRLEGIVTKRDAGRDLASIAIEANGLPACRIGDSSRLRTGELVIAVGNPFGFIGALTTGVVHAAGPLAGGGRSWIQADVRLAPGNSGGPLADAHGSVIGINTMIAGGLALAIPSNTIERFLRTAQTPSLGVVVRPVRLADGEGVLVLEVERGGAVGSASILPGDVLIGVDGRRFQRWTDLGDALESCTSDVLRVDFIRGDKRVRMVAIRLAAAAAEAA